jgi:mannose-1-phosphate guanylyltransferase
MSGASPGAMPWCVVLAGGVGSRFWPMSTPERPKQLLPLVSDAPLLADTLSRLAPLAPPSRTLILTNASLAPTVRAMAPELPADQVIAEPRPAGTCAALAWAAQEIARRAGPEAVMLCVHADWAIGDVAGFRAALSHAAEVAAARQALVTVGVVPSRPDPGFGYIQAGAEVEPGVRSVARFVEKPDRARAEQMVADGFLWNSGIFAWRVGDLLSEIAALTPEVAPALAAHPDDRDAFFAAVQSVAIDVGVLERSERVLVLAGDFGWDDVGTWAALHRVRAHDGSGNAAFGRLHAVAAHDNVVHTEGAPVVLYGVDGLVVVVHAGVVLVTTRERAADLKTLLDTLPDDLRSP